MASQLSPRQREILDLVAEGRTSKEIAVTLGISESTVNWHLANAFQRLGASSRAEAVALAIRSNGADRAPKPTGTARPALTAAHAWPHLAAIAIAIAIAGALLGGATVAALRLGPIGPPPAPTASPASHFEATPTPSPASGSREDVLGGEVVPIGGTVDVGPDPIAPASLVPALSAPALPKVVVPVPIPALPSLPATPPPLPSIPIPLPTALPTPPLPLP
jgi:DNA-binding CsgD family transcriptional regulator